MSNRSSETYVVATIHEWNYKAFFELSSTLPGEWVLLRSKEELTQERLATISPRYVFFPHWSWIVPDQILTNFECVCFHMTDVPYGRGGSPLQNLIKRGHRETKLTALRMVTELDAGPVYGKLPVTLDGRAQDIYERIAKLCYAHIRSIVINKPEPVEQKGEVVSFSRLTPEQSALQCDADITSIYDHIRMLDAESYPKAFLECGDYRLEFTHAEKYSDSIEAKVKIIPKDI